MPKINLSRRNFLRVATKSVVALSVVAVAPAAAGHPAIKSDQPSSEHILDLDVNCMYMEPHFPEGSLWLDTDNNELHRKVKLNEHYGKIDNRDYDSGYVYAPWITFFKTTTSIG